ncbi:MAG: UDP-N-acetylmuramate dehydrogenase [Planctomycetota bacterium]|nr:UDP-N-acetylmuramate dehydrogenase [Planctomycetota bacterium]
MSPDIRLLKKHLLRDATSWRCGGPCALYCEAGSLDELRRALNTAQREGLEVKVLGGGTNVLASDEGVRAMVIKLAGEFEQLRVGPSTVCAGAAASLDRFISVCCENGRGGLERCAGIPGTVGGAVAGNAGVPNCWTGDFVKSLTVCDDKGEIRTLSAEECGFGYRHSDLTGIVLRGTFELGRGEPCELLSDAREAKARRRKIPCGNTAGSVFKNPDRAPAGKLLEDAGMKGASEGGARYSTQHANFIVNDGGTASDIRRLMLLGQKAVHEKFGVELEPEVRLWGFDGDGGEL